MPKSTKPAPTVLKITKLRKKQLVSELNSIAERELLDILTQVGVGEQYFTCYLCGNIKTKNDFYISTDPMAQTGIVRICRECGNLVANSSEDDFENSQTKQNIQAALEYLDKPFLNAVWDASVQEVKNESSAKKTIWGAYIKTIAMQQYHTLRWKDGDIYNSDKNVVRRALDTEASKDKSMMEELEQNRNDVIRLLGYDPFAKELSEDKPLLYATLVGYLGQSEDANADQMRVSSIVEIVKSFNHLEKVNDSLSVYMKTPELIDKNASTIKTLEEVKNKINSTIINLARDNGISLKHSVNASKGENTWTGKVKKLKDLKLREAEVNLFEAETAKGIEQVADISNKSILKQLMFDENDFNDMLIQQRELIGKYKRVADENEETARKLFRENADLKDTLTKLGGI